MSEKIDVRVGDTWERRRNGKRVVVARLPVGASWDVHYLREDGKEGLTWFKDFHNTFRFIRRGDEPYREAIMASLITVQDLKKALASFPNEGYLEIRVDPSGSAGVAYLDRETRKYTTVWERA